MNQASSLILPGEDFLFYFLFSDCDKMIEVDSRAGKVFELPFYSDFSDDCDLFLS